MRSFTLLSFVSAALAARPFLNEPDTGIEEIFGDLPAGELPPLDRLVGGAGQEGILYIPALRTTRSGEDIANARVGGQVTFQQVYLEHNDTAT